MSERLKRAQELIERPSESLSVEIKRWIDPDQPSGQAQIVRAALALRNHNGGYLIVGFDNDTLLPDQEHVLSDVRQLFHSDKIQALISKHASEPFEVFVDFPELIGQEYPVLTIPSGIKSPVAVKADLQINGKTAIFQNDIYMRTLNSNNIPSSSKAGWKDWTKITEICFENREADIGRFLRRHLSALTPDATRSIVSELAKYLAPEVTVRERIERYLLQSADRFQQVSSTRPIALTRHGAWEVALLITGNTQSHSANKEFLNLLKTSNPQYTGWPVWIVTDGFRDQSMNPYVYNCSWEEFIYIDETRTVTSYRTHNSLLGFIRLNPQGYFYERRALQEDMRNDPGADPPLTILDFVLPVIRTAEAIAVGIAFARAMDCSPSDAKLSFAFRWSGLRGRNLVSWVKQERHLYPKGPSQQDEVTSFVDVPMDTPLSAIGGFVAQVVKPLFEIFDGFSLGIAVIEELTREILERR